MIVTTTPTLDGYHITEYLGVVMCCVQLQAEFPTPSVRSLFPLDFKRYKGDRAEFGQAFVERRQQAAFEELQQRATRIGADALIGVTIVVSYINGTVAQATGTAVRIEPIKD